MKLKKKFLRRFFAVLLLIGAVVASVWYWQLSNRHKAIVKTTLLHTFRIIDHDWEIQKETERLTLESPDLLVDNIYQSMDGPQAVINLNLNEGGAAVDHRF